MSPFSYKFISREFMEEMQELVLKGDSIILLGARYTGKRVVMSRLYQDLLEKEPDTILIALKLRQMTPISSDLQLSRVIEREINKIVDQRGGKIPNTDSYREKSFFVPIERLIAETQKPIILLASNVDSLGHHLARQFLKYIRTRVQRGDLIVVLSGEEDLRDLVHGVNSEFECANQYVIQGFDEEEFRDFISKSAEVLKIVFESSESAYELLWHRTGGNPFLLKLLLWSVVERRLRSSLLPDEMVKVSDIPDSLDKIYTPGIYEIDIMRHSIRLIARKPECWKDLEHLINDEPRKILLKDDAPSPLELFGVAVREDGCLRFSSPLKKDFFRQYYKGLGFGDLYARNGQWSEAFARYDRPDLEEIVRPLNIDDRSEVDSTITALCAFLHQAATENVSAVKKLFGQGCRYVLGFKEVTFWEHDELGQKWQFHSLEVLPTKKDAKKEIQKMVSKIEGLKPDELGLINVPRHWKGLATAAVLPSVRSNQCGLVVISDIERGITISRERQELAEKLLKHFVRAYTHAITVERNSVRLSAREQHVQIVNSIFESLGKDVLNVKQALIMAAEKLRKLGYKRVSFCLVDPESKRIKGVWDASDDSSIDVAELTDYALDDPNADLQPYVIHTRKPRIIPDARKEPLANPKVVQLAKMKSEAIVPILNRIGDAIGTVHIERDDGAIPTREEVEDLLYFGRQLAIAVEQSERVNLLQSTLDKLPAPVLIVDRLGRLRYANRPSKDLFDIPTGWLAQAEAKTLTDGDLGGLFKYVRESLRRGRVVDHVKKIAEKENYGSVLCDAVRDWENRTVGAFLHLQDLNDLHRMLQAYRLLAEAKDTESALSSLIDAANVLGYEWGRLYVADEIRPNSLISRKCFGPENEKIKEEFNNGKFVLERVNEPGHVEWRCIDEKKPLTFSYIKKWPNGKKFSTRTGLEVTNVNPPYSPSPWMEKKPGDMWVHFPLVSKVVGKLVLPCTKNLRPEQVEFLQVLSEMASGLFDAFLDRDKEFRKRADRVVADIVHHFGTRLKFLPGLLWRYTMVQEGSTGVQDSTSVLKETNRDFTRGFEDLLAWIERTKRQLLSKLRLQPNLEVSPIDLTAFLKHILEFSHFRREYDLDPKGHEMTLHADAHQLEDAFTELLHNSKEMGGKRISLIIEKFARPIRQEPWMRIIYRDNGPGVPNEFKERIFEDFFSRRPAQKSSTGLGLGTVRRAIEAHGGTIRENGKPTEGVQFVIEIPVSTAETR